MIAWVDDMAYWTCDVVDTQLQIFCGNVVLTGRAVGAYRLDGFSDIVVRGFIDHELIFNQGAGGRVIFVFVSGACSFRQFVEDVDLFIRTFSSVHEVEWKSLNVCFEGIDVNILFSSDVLESWCESVYVCRR